MDWPAATRLFLLLNVLAVILADAVAIWFGGPKASMSVAIRDFCFANPIVAFMAGVVVGHLLWPTP